MSDLKAALQPIIDRYLGDTFPTCAVCVLQHGQMLLDTAYGWIDPEIQRIPAQPNTLFDLASITKLFTTTAFLALVSEGQVKLDDPLVKVVPEFGTISPRPIDGGQDPHSKITLPTPSEYSNQTVDPALVTFRHLLTHTSGLPPWRDVFNAAGEAPPPLDQVDPTPQQTRWERGLAALCEYAFVAPPDGVVRYSDVGLMLLGEAVTRLSQFKDLETAIYERVLKPLGHADVLFNPVRKGGKSLNQIAPTEEDPTWRKRRVWGEVHDENACGVGGAAGHAGLFASANAVAALGQAWLEGAGIFGITSAIAQAAISEQVDSDGTRRGLGFALKAKTDSMAGERLSLDSFGHSGFTGTTLWIDPQAELVISLMTNRVYPGRWHEGIHEFRRAAHDAIAEACGVR